MKCELTTDPGHVHRDGDPCDYVRTRECTVLRPTSWASERLWILYNLIYPLKWPYLLLIIRLFTLYLSYTKLIKELSFAMRQSDIPTSPLAPVTAHVDDHRPD